MSARSSQRSLDDFPCRIRYARPEAIDFELLLNPAPKLRIPNHSRAALEHTRLIAFGVSQRTPYSIFLRWRKIDVEQLIQESSVLGAGAGFFRHESENRPGDT